MEKNFNVIISFNPSPQVNLYLTNRQKKWWPIDGHGQSRGGGVWIGSLCQSRDGGAVSVRRQKKGGTVGRYGRQEGPINRHLYKNMGLGGSHELNESRPVNAENNNN